VKSQIFDVDFIHDDSQILSIFRPCFPWCGSSVVV
jgi:hypothetical protein